MANSDRRIPVISNQDELSIPWHTLQTIISGRSLLDTFELNIDNLDEANKFLNAYGVQNDKDADKLLATALDYIDNILLKDDSLCLPENIYDLRLPELLLRASDSDRSAISEWSCVVLKVCHAVAHAQWTKDEDAYHTALAKLKARLNPFVIESPDGIWVGDDDCRVPIVDYHIKTEKKFPRIVTKLLLKEGNLSARVYDHIGVRFVTNDIFSAILLVKFLRSRHIFMYANLLPQKSKNSMTEFHKIVDLFSKFSTPIRHTVVGEGDNIRGEGINPYSNKEFKMIKIVERILVSTSNGRHVFFPCEFQIVTRQMQDALGKNRANHTAYEKRQINGVNKRLFSRTSLLGNS